MNGGERSLTQGEELLGVRCFLRCDAVFSVIEGVFSPLFFP